MAYRARARNLLPQITQDVKRALDEASIDVFLMIPASGDAVATFGTAIDPPDEVWERASEIVCSIVRAAVVGLDRVQCRELACATTADQSGLLTSADLAAEPRPLPTPMPSLPARGER
jgi:hypothetical protein